MARSIGSTHRPTTHVPTQKNWLEEDSQWECLSISTFGREMDSYNCQNPKKYPIKGIPFPSRVIHDKQPVFFSILSSSFSQFLLIFLSSCSLEIEVEDTTKIKVSPNPASSLYSPSSHAQAPLPAIKFVKNQSRKMSPTFLFFNLFFSFFGHKHYCSLHHILRHHTLTSL